ncbi:unnamed protein product [Ceutorhynchus assimilis]|uniref:Sperm-associated antigen 1 n=1 Tax=Ceutorhynchus assimilis TaxID=467358 RepID=A0A9P0GR28_9CUCU|nr:unnamed protein product [Ceutorhynchus assimilis]
MSTIEDLQNIEEYQQNVYINHARGESLMEKYGIPIQHYEFDYVAKAKDAEELEKMTLVLRSGQEGYFPDLLRAIEDKLQRLKPESKLLKYSTPVLRKQDLLQNDRNEINQDLRQWVTDMSKNSRELDKRKTNKIQCDVKIRQTELQHKPVTVTTPKSTTRIASTDFQAWDRYDPDAELLKQELEEEKMKIEAKKAEKASEKLRKEAEQFVYAGTSSQSCFVMAGLDRKPKKSVSFNQHSTETEAAYLSDRELEKGREFYVAGDYELALKCFTQSILSKPQVININNRALTHLKLGHFKEALEDTNKVLALDEGNLKANLRKAQALEGKGLSDKWFERV